MEDPSIHPESQQVATVVADNTSYFQQDTPMEKIRKKLQLIRANLFLLLSPGDKQFKDLPKRVRLMLVSFIIPILLGVIKVFLLKTGGLFPWWIITSLALGAITYGAVFWGLKGQVRRESFGSVLPIASWFVVAYTLFLITTFVTPVNRLFLWFFFIVALTVFMVLLYILALAVNILNVSLFYTIPLSRLGESVSYLSAVVTMFLLSDAVATISLPYWYTRDWMNLLPWGIFYFVVIFGVISYLWLYFLQMQRGVWGFVFATTVLISGVFYSMFLVLPAAWHIAAVVSAVGYMVLGLIIHKEQNTLKLSVYIELFAIFVALLSFLLFG